MDNRIYEYFTSKVNGRKFSLRDFTGGAITFDCDYRLSRDNMDFKTPLAKPVCVILVDEATYRGDGNRTWGFDANVKVRLKYVYNANDGGVLLQAIKRILMYVVPASEDYFREQHLRLDYMDAKNIYKPTTLVDGVTRRDENLDMLDVDIEFTNTRFPKDDVEEVL